MTMIIERLYLPAPLPRARSRRDSETDTVQFAQVALAGYKIVNIDCVLVMHRPKIVPIAGDMRARLADLLGLEMNRVSIKGKTPDRLGLLLSASTQEILRGCEAQGMERRGPQELLQRSAHRGVVLDHRDGRMRLCHDSDGNDPACPAATLLS